MIAKKYLTFALILLVFAFLVARFFEYFPNGWDQTETAWAIQQNYLPHSPYILYFFISKLFYQFIPDPAIALSSLSSLFGLFSLVMFYFIQHGFVSSQSNVNQPLRRTSWIPVLAVLFLATNYLFIRQSATQEPYTLQTFFVFLSLWLLLKPTPGRFLASGVAFGCAFAVHNGSIFLVPGFIYLTLRSSKQINFKRGLIVWSLAAGLVAVVFFGVMYAILPRVPGDNPLITTLIYARGLGPGISSSSLSDPTFLVRSAGELWERLFSLNVPHLRRPPPSFPLGLTLLNLLVAGIGIVFSWRRNRSVAIFWLLYSLPYLAYEIAAGETPDFGAYLVFTLPALTIFIAYGIVSIIAAPGLTRQRKLFSRAFALLLVGLLILPSGVLIVQNWKDVEIDLLDHYSPWVLAEIIAANSLPEDAILIQPKDEWNVNHLPFYTERHHIARNRDQLYLFQDRGAYTPLNPGSFELLTTEKLSSIIGAGTPVYAFDRDPLIGASLEVLDASQFVWEPAFSLDLSQAHSQITIPSHLRGKLSEGIYVIYKGNLKPAEDF